MLTLVLFLLFVHISAVPMILQPLKSLANNKKMIMNKSLVEELADADPAQVQELLDLIETMLLAAHTNLDNLELECTNANNDYDTAVAAYEAALLAHNGIIVIYNVALEAKNAALEAKIFAHGVAVEAQKNSDELKPGLDNEIKTLTDMIRLNEQLSSPNQGMTDMLKGMLLSAQTDLGNLERQCIDTKNNYNDKVIAYNAVVIAFDAAKENLRVSLEALTVAQEAKDVAEGVKTEAQNNLDTGKPGFEVEISNLEEMLRIHGRLKPKCGDALDSSSYPTLTGYEYTKVILAVNTPYWTPMYWEVKNVPEFLEGAVLFRGPRYMKEGADISITTCGRSRIYIVTRENANGGWLSSLDSSWTIVDEGVNGLDTVQRFFASKLVTGASVTTSLPVTTSGLTHSILVVQDKKLSFHLPGATTSAYARVLNYEFPSESDFSVEGWIKLPVSNRNKYFFSFNTAGNDNCLLLRSSIVPINTWVHLTVNVDSNRAITTFINGSPHNVAYTGTFCGNKIGSLMIGQDQDTVGGGLDAGQAPEILFDSLRVYQGILSDADILQLSSKQKCIVREPWSNWAFADSVDVGKDYSQKEQHFEVVGGDITDGVSGCISESD